MNINNLKLRIEALSEKLENDPDYEMSDEMQEEYYIIKRELKCFENHPRDFKELEFLKTSFMNLWRYYDNPDGVTDAILNDMFPDTNGEFEIDDMN